MVKKVQKASSQQKAELERTNKSNEVLKKAWAYVKSWSIGVKVIAVLVIIGMIVELFKRL